MEVDLKTKPVIIHNIINYIKNLNVLNNKEDIEIHIDEKFYDENLEEINKKIKNLNSSFKINFICKSIPKDIYEFNNDLIIKVKILLKRLLTKIRLKTQILINLTEEKLKKS